VIAQSVVFPSAAPELSTSDGSPVASFDAVIEQGAVAGARARHPGQGRVSRATSQARRTRQHDGFSGTSGSLDVDALGRVPFQFAAPKFVATSCARRLLVKVAIADVCLLGAGLADSVKQGKVNLWIPDNGSPFAVAGKAQNIDGIGAPATLTINRNVAANPLPASCGAGIDVTSDAIGRRRHGQPADSWRLAMMGLRTLASLAVAAVATTALAHTQDGTLGDTAASTDYYQITCSDDGSGVPASMMVQVQHRGPAAVPVSCCRASRYGRDRNGGHGGRSIRRRARSFS
jgi:hypothetical protein